MKRAILISAIFCIISGSVFLPVSGYAALTAVDWQPNSGDGWLTRDTVSELDWLDVTLTTNQTFDQVRTGIWYQRGFPD